MKLAILPSWYPNRKNPNSGIFIRNQAIDLADEIETDVLVLRKGWPSKITQKEGPLTTYIKSYIGLPNTNIKRLHKWGETYLNFYSQKHQKSNYDIIHAHDHLAGHAAYVINRKWEVPYILTLHNTNFITRSIPEWKLPYVRDVIKHAEKVIVVGQKLYEVIQEDYNPENLILIPNYIDTSRFTLRGELPSNPFKFLTVTSLFYKKRIDKMIEAFASIRDKVNAELHIVGSGEDRNNLERIVKNLNLDSNVKFHGSVSNEQLVPFYHQSHAYLSTSLVETFGVSIIEAMSCGLPVLCTPSGGPEYIVDNTSGMVSGPEAFDKNMLKLINNFDQYNPESIRSKVEENYSKNKIIPQILNIYKSVLRNA